MAELSEMSLYIGGEWVRKTSEGFLPVINPADETELCMLPVAGKAELDAALTAAEAGFKVWKRTLPLERQQIIKKATGLMRERADAIGRILTLEQGKPLAEAKREVLLSADIIEFLAEEGKRLAGRTVPPRMPNILSQTVVRQPIGPVAAFTPWNFPANLPSRKLGAALAAGCSVVIKPAEETPATCMEIVRAFHDAGLPKGVLNMVCGVPADVSRHLIESPIIKKVSFTGSIPVGKALGEMAARGVKRYSAELGGHAPVIVCADADVEAVVKLSVLAKFRNAGQICASPIRFYIHESKYVAFRDAFVAATQSLKVGNGLAEGINMGPLISSRRLVEMQGFVDDAIEHGAKILCGGKRIKGKGYFYEPTVIENAPLTARVSRVEPFGPIAMLQAFSSLDDALLQANRLPYGLSAYAFTNDLATTYRIAEELEAGMVGINHFGVSQPETPFGGWKESGIGQEGGLEGLLAYTDVKLISIAK